MPSITGHSLIGHNLTRFVYLDETGISSGDKDTIVAGVFVNPDIDIDAIERGLIEVMMDKVPEPIWIFETTKSPKGFIFHAKDYIHGTGPFKSLKKSGDWDSGKGREIASALIDVIEKNNIKCVWGKASNSGGIEGAYTLAILQMMIRVDHFMLSNYQNEVCMVVAEASDYKKMLKKTLITLKHPMGVHLNKLDGSQLPLRTIKDTVHFVEKSECKVIQLADTACYIIKKALAGDKYYETLANRLNAALLA